MIGSILWLRLVLATKTVYISRDQPLVPEVPNHSFTPSLFLRGAAVVSEWLKVRVPSRTILNCEGQHGSGHAIRASVVIQSFLEVNLCFAASSGSTEAITDVLEFIHACASDLWNVPKL